MTINVLRLLLYPFVKKEENCDDKNARGRPRWMYSEQEAADLARGHIFMWEALPIKIWIR